MVHVFSEHLSPVEESAGNKKTEGRNDLANYNRLTRSYRSVASHTSNPYDKSAPTAAASGNKLCRDSGGFTRK
jgi:hypothetical protein